MTAGRIVLVRHGQTDYNLEGRVQGNIDIELNATGREQAAQCAIELPRFLDGRPVGAMVSSDLSRARDTAQAISDRLGIGFTEDPRLRERAFGEFEGLSREELETYRSEEYALWKAGIPPVEMGVEPKLDVARRMVAAATEHAQDLEEDSTLVVVSHGSALTFLMMSLMEDDPERGWPLRGLENCHWSELGYQSERAPTWQLRHHNVRAATVSTA